MQVIGMMLIQSLQNNLFQARNNMFIVAYRSISNDTYQDLPFLLAFKVEPDNEDSGTDIFFKELPDNIKEEVEFNYDGVWQPQLDTIEVYKVEKIEDWDE